MTPSTPSGDGDVTPISPSEHESSEVFEPDTIDVYKQLHENVIPPFVTSTSPSGFFTEFAAGRRTNDEALAEFSEEPSIMSDSGTLLGRAGSYTKMDSDYNFMDKRTRQQLKRGGRVMDNITTPRSGTASRRRPPSPCFWRTSASRWPISSSRTRRGTTRICTSKSPTSSWK